MKGLRLVWLVVAWLGSYGVWLFNRDRIALLNIALHVSLTFFNTILYVDMHVCIYLIHSLSYFPIMCNILFLMFHDSIIPLTWEAMSCTPQSFMVGAGQLLIAS